MDNMVGAPPKATRSALPPFVLAQIQQEVLSHVVQHHLSMLLGFGIPNLEAFSETVSVLWTSEQPSVQSPGQFAVPFQTIRATVQRFSRHLGASLKCSTRKSGVFPKANWLHQVAPTDWHNGHMGLTVGNHSTHSKTDTLRTRHSNESLQLREFVHQNVRNCAISPACMIVGCMLFEDLLHTHSIPFETLRGSFELYYLVCVILASKVNEDRAWGNSMYLAAMRCSQKITPQQLREAETSVLSILDFSLLRSRADMQQFLGEMKQSIHSHALSKSNKVESGLLKFLSCSRAPPSKRIFSTEVFRSF